MTTSARTTRVEVAGTAVEITRSRTGPAACVSARRPSVRTAGSAGAASLKRLPDDSGSSRRRIRDSARRAAPPQLTTVDDLAYLYLDLIDALDLRDVVLVGASLGGWIAAEMAVKTTERISHLVLLDAVGIKVGDRETRDIADIYAITDNQLAEIAYADPQRMARDPKSLPEERIDR